MGISIRRFLVLQSLMVWQGGFLFYACIVVPIGTDLLGSALEQGFITQQVSLWMNYCGWLCLALLGWDVWADRRRFFRTRLAIVIVNFLTLAVLAWYLHPQMSLHLDVERHGLTDRHRFYWLHQFYLIGVSIHWFTMLAFVWLTLRCWHKENESP